MDKIWHQSVNKCPQKKVLAPKDIHAVMFAILADEANHQSAGELRRTSERLVDSTNSGRLANGTTRKH